MIFTHSDALLWVERLISVAITLQTLELLQLQRVVANSGVWNWKVVKKEFEIFPSGVQLFFDLFLKYPHFIFLMIARLVCAVLLLIFPHFILVGVLFFTQVLISLRWRGTFNGGSDFMTLIVLMALGVATLFKGHSQIEIGCLWYISIQVCSSYFISGVIKLKKKNWRSGKALVNFMNSTIYRPTALTRWVSGHAMIAGMGSWMILLFECSFPLALFHPESCLIVIVLAMLFHLANFYIFGLNRFLFAWSATYPALYFCSLCLV